MGTLRARSFGFFLPLLAAVFLWTSGDRAAAAVGGERRVALVIGNSAYQYVPHLPNPTNDAEAIAASLQRLGFEVTKGIDLDRAGTEKIIRAFSAQLPGAKVALLYYAGHGIQVADRNYIIPVDAQLNDETDLDFEATGIDLVMRLMEREPRMNLVFLDACRDNPLAQNLARSMGSTRSLAIGRGLAFVDAEVGSFIAFATQPHTVALDGNGDHSPFTAALLRHMGESGVNLSDMMVEVRNDVMAATDGKQVPWDHSSLTGSFYFQPAVATAAATTDPTPASGATTLPSAPPSAGTVDKEVVFWDSIKDSNSPAQFEAYLDQFPNGTFAPLAHVRLDELKTQAAQAAPAVPPHDQVASLTPAADAPPPEQAERSIGLSRDGRVRVQVALKLLGYDIGAPDGVFGPKSRTAISAWQTTQGDAATGYLTTDQHTALLAAAAPQLAAWDLQQQKNAELARQRQAAAAAAQAQAEAEANQAATSQAATSQTTYTQSAYSNTAAQNQAAADAAASQAEADRLRQENDALRRQQAQQEQDRQNLQFGLGLFSTVVNGTVPFTHKY